MDWHSSVLIHYKMMDNAVHNAVHNAASQAVIAWRNVSQKYKTDFTEVNRSKGFEGNESSKQLGLFRANKSTHR